MLGCNIKTFTFPGSPLDASQKNISLFRLGDLGMGCMVLHWPFRHPLAFFGDGNSKGRGPWRAANDHGSNSRSVGHRKAAIVKSHFAEIWHQIDIDSRLCFEGNLPLVVNRFWAASIVDSSSSKWTGSGRSLAWQVNEIYVWQLCFQDCVLLLSKKYVGFQWISFPTRNQLMPMFDAQAPSIQTCPRRGTRRHGATKARCFFYPCYSVEIVLGALYIFYIQKV